MINIKQLLVVMVSLLCSKDATASVNCGDSSQNYCNVAITTLTAKPEVFHGRIVLIHGYLGFIAKGPRAGYWLSADNFQVPYGNSISLKIPENSPQRNWIESGEKYSVRGLFKDCRPQVLYSQNCYFKIEPISELGIIEIMPMYVE